MTGNPQDYVTSTINPDGSVTLGAKIRTERHTRGWNIWLDANKTHALGAPGLDVPHTINGNFDVNGPARIWGRGDQPNVINGGFGRSRVYFDTSPGSSTYGRATDGVLQFQTIRGGSKDDVINADQMGDKLQVFSYVQTTNPNTGETLRDLFENGDADTVYALQGNDIINGGTGDDTLFGGDGSDVINGGPYPDEIHGNGEWSGWPELITETPDYNNTAPDVLNGGDGDDRLYGFVNGAIMNGGNGRDRLSAYYNSHFNGNGSVMDGGPGNDDIYGGSGKDVVIMSESGYDDLLGLNYDHVSFLDGSDEFIIPMARDGFASTSVSIRPLGGFMWDQNRVGHFVATQFGTTAEGETKMIGKTIASPLNYTDRDPLIKLKLYDGTDKIVSPTEIFNSPNQDFIMSGNGKQRD